jgi:dTDP-4-dehydrorhamnose reductase
LKKPILIFGSTGLLGSQLSIFFKKNYNVVTVGHTKKNCNFNIDLNYKNKTLKLIKKIKPRVIINCVAYTDVDKCNSNLNTAFDKNIISVFNIVESLKKLKQKIHLIHISTDQVYNNKRIAKKNSEHQINLLNNYGLTKFMGEKQIINYKLSTILRTNFFGNSIESKKKSYSDWIKYNLKKNKVLKIPNNVYFNPIHITFLSKIIEIIINKKIFGTYNVGSKNGVSKYKFVNLVAKKLNLNIKIIKKFKSNMSTHRKPLGTIMNVKKIEKKLKLNLPNLKKSIELLY